MSIRWTSDLAEIDLVEMQTLYRLALPGDKSVEYLKTVFGNSRYKFFAYEEGKLVAAGRALADGADCSYLCDIAVLPSHQGKGLGGAVITRLIEASRGHKKIILYAVPGKEGFYRRFGFLRMPTAMGIFQNRESALESGYLIEG